MYLFSARWCPDIEEPPNLQWLTNNPARLPRGFWFRDLQLVIEVAAKGGNRRAARVSRTYAIVASQEQLRSIDLPVLFDLPVKPGDIVAAVSVDGREIGHAQVMIRDRYSPVLHIPLPHGGIASGETRRVEVTYDVDAYARIDAD